MTNSIDGDSRGTQSVMSMRKLEGDQAALQARAESQLSASSAQREQAHFGQFGQFEAPKNGQFAADVGGGKKRLCDICERPLDTRENLAGSSSMKPDSTSNFMKSSLGHTTLLCSKCQEDILNSNRLLETHRTALESALRSGRGIDTESYQKLTDREFYDRSESILKGGEYKPDQENERRQQQLKESMGTTSEVGRIPGAADVNHLNQPNGLTHSDIILSNIKPGGAD